MHKTILSLTGKLIKYTMAVQENYDQDTIHKLRTGFKKLRALLRWQRVSNDIYEAFRNIYHSAGDIRSVQLLEKRPAEENDELNSFLEWLGAKLQQLKKEWVKVRKKKILDNLQSDIKKLECKFIKNKQFFSGRIKKIKKILSADPVVDDKLHEVRKMVKDMQYVLEYRKETGHKQSDLIKDLSIKKLKKIGKLIGEYNDKRIALVLLTTYAQEETNSFLISRINPVIDKWQEIKINEKEKLISILHYFLHARQVLNPGMP